MTGTLAGYNAVKYCMGLKGTELPVNLACGDIINHENKMKKSKEGLKNRYTFAGASYFERMKELGLYTIDVNEINEKVIKVGLKDFFKQRLC